ncbi:FAD-dependent oxidoreductase [Spirosoma daeguense]
MLTELIDLIGEQQAVRSYKLCIEAIYKVQAIIQSLAIDTHFSLRKSVYYASKKDDIEPLKREFEQRKKHSIQVDWCDKSDLREHFPHDGAQVDAYRLAHALFLFQHCIQKGARVFDTVEVTDIQHNQYNVTLLLENGYNGYKVRTKKLVVACGYESQNYLSKRVVDFNSTYALVSKPIPQNTLWYQNALLWESARPYLYLRTTDDKRVLIGGKDEPFRNAVKRDKLLRSKSRQLEQFVCKLFPELPFTIDYEWCGTFAETKDGLPYIGSVAEHPNTYFALGFGGNGILFSMIAADIITDLLRGRQNTDTSIFGFNR